MLLDLCARGVGGDPALVVEEGERIVRYTLLPSGAVGAQRLRGRLADQPDVPGALSLRGRGNRFGRLELRAPEGSPYDEHRLLLARSLAELAGPALDAARLYAERSHLARVLQESLRPSRLPDVPGLRIAARHRSSQEQDEVGGDFYDVHGEEPRGWTVVVGDVAGHGAEAAVLTGQARQTLRTAGLLDLPLTAALELLDRTVRGGRDERFLTAVLVHLTREGAAWAVEVVRAGHPAPLLLRTDGRVEQVGVPGPLVGVLDAPRWEVTRCLLGPGDGLLLHTDGVLEARGPTGRYGVRRLTSDLSGLGGAEPQVVVAFVEERVMEHLAGQPHDDIALLALRVEP